MQAASPSWAVPADSAAGDAAAAVSHPAEPGCQPPPAGAGGGGKRGEQGGQGGRDGMGGMSTYYETTSQPG
jgi:hypothetical protein